MYHIPHRTHTTDHAARCTHKAAERITQRIAPRTLQSMQHVAYSTQRTTARAAQSIRAQQSMQHATHSAYHSMTQAQQHVARSKYHILWHTRTSEAHKWVHSQWQSSNSNLQRHRDKSPAALLNGKQNITKTVHKIPATQRFKQTEQT